ncbi:hypothetical protein FRC06_006573 [Ceratobasidium sp. 370]|nr:hypothetical protein FRC06_006573 [Ceratobasidium sp. 370]
MHFPIFVVVGALSLVGAVARQQSLAVKLTDATYTGFHNGTSGLDTWLGVRYAAPPLGNLRWRTAQPLVKGNGKVNATALPLQCVQSVATWNASSASEDCLFLNIYAPPNAKNLPVLVWIHGGSWDHNSATQFDPTPLINLSGNKFIAVIIQYRLGVFGFLSGSDAIAKSQGLNAAITALGECKDSYFMGQFKNFTAGAGCLSSNTTDTEQLACLRAAPTDTLKKLNYQMNRPQRGRVNYWTACLENQGDNSGYLKIHPAQALRSGVVAG